MKEHLLPTHNHVTGRSQTRCADTDARNGHTEAENHPPVQWVHGTRAAHTPVVFRSAQTELLSL